MSDFEKGEDIAVFKVFISLFVAAPHNSRVPAANTQITGMTEREADYASRLRAAFQAGNERALMQREDVMGAAAEIEQLWAALWALLGRNNNGQAPDKTYLSYELEAKGAKISQPGPSSSETRFSGENGPYRDIMIALIFRAIRNTGAALQHDTFRIFSRVVSAFTISTSAYCAIHFLFAHFFSLHMLSQAVICGVAAAATAGWFSVKLSSGRSHPHINI